MALASMFTCRTTPSRCSSCLEVTSLSSRQQPPRSTGSSSSQASSRAHARLGLTLCSSCSTLPARVQAAAELPTAPCLAATVALWQPCLALLQQQLVLLLWMLQLPLVLLSTAPGSSGLTLDRSCMHCSLLQLQLHSADWAGCSCDLGNPHRLIVCLWQTSCTLSLQLLPSLGTAVLIDRLTAAHGVGWLLVVVHASDYTHATAPHCIEFEFEFGLSVPLGALHLIQCCITCFADMVSCNGSPQFCGFVQQQISAQHLYD